MVIPAQSFKGFRYGRIGIFCQPDTFCTAVFKGFSQLFCTNYKPLSLQIQVNAALLYFTIFFSIHTKTYYTRNFQKVNKNL